MAGIGANASCTREWKVVAVLSAGPASHHVVFHESEGELAARVTDYLVEAMARGGVAIVAATPDHRQAFRDRLIRAGVDLARATASGTYIELDAAAVVETFMIHGWADPASFWRAITPLLKVSEPGRRPVAIFTEMVALLWQRGQVNAAVDVEALWNELAKQYTFDILCAYPVAALDEPEHADAIAEVCSAHSAAYQAAPNRR